MPRWTASPHRRRAMQELLLQTPGHRLRIEIAFPPLPGRSNAASCPWHRSRTARRNHQRDAGSQRASPRRTSASRVRPAATCRTETTTAARSTPSGCVPAWWRSSRISPRVWSTAIRSGDRPTHRNRPVRPDQGSHALSLSDRFICWLFNMHLLQFVSKTTSKQERCQRKES